MTTQSTTTTVPAYEIFLQPHVYRVQNLWVDGFLLSLQTGEPRRIPMELYEGTSKNPVGSAMSLLNERARKLGFHVACRSFRGSAWVCRLKDGDAARRMSVNVQLRHGRNAY